MEWNREKEKKRRTKCDTKEMDDEMEFANNQWNCINRKREMKETRRKKNGPSNLANGIISIVIKHLLMIAMLLSIGRLMLMLVNRFFFSCLCSNAKASHLLYARCQTISMKVI